MHSLFSWILGVPYFQQKDVEKSLLERLKKCVHSIIDRKL